MERISAEDHRELAEEFCDFMAGRTGTYLRRLERQMAQAAEEMEYERAARLRDDIGALKKAMEKNAVVLADATDADLIAVAEDELEAAVQIFHVRGGRVRGQRGWVTDKVEEITTGALVEHALQQLYGEETGDAVPREVLVPALPDPVEPVQEWLTGRRGANVSLRVPQRGDKKALMETVQRNAQQALVLHRTKRASDLTTRSRALEEISDALGLDSAPLRIECYDISHLQGDDVVASMVVFEDGLARKSEYRRFQIKGFAGQDDVRSMHEVITRRFRRYLAEKERTGSGPTARSPARRRLHRTARWRGRAARVSPSRPRAPSPRTTGAPSGSRTRRSWSWWTAARRRSRRHSGRWTSWASTTSRCAVSPSGWRRCGCPATTTRWCCPGPARACTCCQRIRDEAHRFAITYQRTKRAKRFRSSPLDDVPGLGDTRKQALIKHFGSLKRLRSATIEQICDVPGIGRKTAETIVAALAQAVPGGPAVNTATGEIMDDTEEPGQQTGSRGARVHGRPGRTTGAGAMTEHETGSGDRAAQQAGGATARAGVRQDNGAQVKTGKDNGGVPEVGIPELVIISGMSGAGRSTAAKCLEDLGWFVVDNLPPALIPTMVELGARSQGNVARIAVVVDVRGLSASSTTCASPSPTSTRAASPGARSSWSPPTRRWCAASSPCAARTRSRATAGSSMASPPSGSCCASCVATPTW